MSLRNANLYAVASTSDLEHANFLSQTEANAIEALRTIVTQKVNPAVHRMTFKKISQAEKEAIQTYLVRLKSAAIECSFECENCHHDLSSTNIKDQFISGLSNNILQTEILAKANQLKTLEEVVSHAEAYETALRDQNQLSNEQKPTAVFGASPYSQRNYSNTNKNSSSKSNNNNNNSNGNNNNSNGNNSNSNSSNNGNGEEGGTGGKQWWGASRLLEKT